MNQLKDQIDQEPQDSYGHVLKYTGIFGGVQGLKILMNIIRNKLTSIFLGSWGMGLNAIFQNIAELINASTNFGISFSSLRNLSELYEEGSDEDIRRFLVVIRTWCLWTAIIGMAICFFGATWISHYYFPTGASHIKEILLLSLFIGSMPIEAGECSILKGLRKLKVVAKVEVFATIATFLFTVPFYYFLGVYGVVISLVSCGWVIALIHLYYSTKLFPYKVRLFSVNVIKAGIPLIKIGIPYVLAAVAGALTTTLIFKTFSDHHQVGLYKACYGLMVTYAGMVFVAIEADFFPRLSSVNHDYKRMNYVINQQIDVCVSLMTPLLILMVLCMPMVIRILWTREFMPVKAMADAAVFYMFFKSITTPIAYSSLAKGDSILYLIMEIIYDVAIVFLMKFAYAEWGLTGSGIALSLISLFDLILISTTYGWMYKYRIRFSTLRLIVPQFVLLAIVVFTCFFVSPRIPRYSICMLALIVSSVISWKFMRRDEDFMHKVLSRFRKGDGGCDCCK